METYKQNITTHLEVLGYIVKEADPDGVELYWTMSDEVVKEKNTRPLIEALRRRTFGEVADIGDSLGRILREYQSKLQKFQREQEVYRSRRFIPGLAPTAPRPLSIYILTNGLWQPECDAAGPIKELIQQLKICKCQRKQVGIQFIRFGDDPYVIALFDEFDMSLDEEW